MNLIIILSKPSQLSAKLAAMQPLGLVPSGPPIRWDARDDKHEDYLAPDGKVQ